MGGVLCGVVTRGPLGSVSFVLSLSGYVTFLSPLLGVLHFLCNQILRKGEVAATEADRKRIK